MRAQHMAVACAVVLCGCGGALAEFVRLLLQPEKKCHTFMCRFGLQNIIFDLNYYFEVILCLIYNV